VLTGISAMIASLRMFGKSSFSPQVTVPINPALMVENDLHKGIMSRNAYMLMLRGADHEKTIA